MSKAVCSKCPCTTGIMLTTSDWKTVCLECYQKGEGSGCKPSRIK